MSEDLKDYRNNELNSFVIGNALIILLFSGFWDKLFFSSTELTFLTLLQTLFSSAVFSSIIYVVVFISDSILSQGLKNKLIWLFTGRPGDNIFTNIRKNSTDFRFTSEQALDAYSAIYREIDQVEGDNKKRRRIENSSWYKIYKKYERHPQIHHSQRDFLLCRDMTSMTIVISICYIIMQRYRGEKISFKLIGFLFFEFVITWYAAYNKSKAFAYNVIAHDLSVKEKNS